MSKENPGIWEPPEGKPEEYGLMDNALARIAQNTSGAAFEIAADRAKAAGMEYGTSEVVSTIAPRNTGMGPGQALNQRQANFDSIEDDYQYDVATALYKSGQPDQSIELKESVAAELYTEDLSILYIKAGRTLDHIDIDTFRSYTGLSNAWNELLSEAGY